MGETTVGFVLTILFIMLAQVLVISTAILIPVFVWLDRRRNLRLWHYLTMSFAIGYIVSASVEIYRQVQLSDSVPSNVGFIGAILNYVPPMEIVSWLDNALYGAVLVPIPGFLWWWSRPNELGERSTSSKLGYAVLWAYLGLCLFLSPTAFFSFS